MEKKETLSPYPVDDGIQKEYIKRLYSNDEFL